jgi:Holliday junction resolvase
MEEVQDLAVRFEMTPEAKVKKRVVDQLKELGCYYFYPITRGYGHSGVPDIVGCHRGYFFAIECKAGGNRTTALQQFNIDRIHESGGKAWVIDEHNAHMVKIFLRMMTGETLSNHGRPGAQGSDADAGRREEGGQVGDVGSEDDVGH